MQRPKLPFVVYSPTLLLKSLPSRMIIHSLWVVDNTRFTDHRLWDVLHITVTLDQQYCRERIFKTHQFDLSFASPLNPIISASFIAYGCHDIPTTNCYMMNMQPDELVNFRVTWIFRIPDLHCRFPWYWENIFGSHTEYARCMSWLDCELVFCSCPIICEVRYCLDFSRLLA